MKKEININEILVLENKIKNCQRNNETDWFLKNKL